jgi:hypothetical protein
VVDPLPLLPQDIRAVRKRSRNNYFDIIFILTPLYTNILHVYKYTKYYTTIAEKKHIKKKK